MAERFPADRIGLRRIFTGSGWQGCTDQVMACHKVDSVYGPLRFPPLLPERSYTYGSFVASIDGRIAWPQMADGTLIARSNLLDPDGGLCDFWILNLLRAACEAVIMGSLTIQREPRLSGRIFDPELLDCRLAEGRAAIPLHVIVSASGRNLPLKHKIFTMKEIPSLIALPPAAARRLLSERPQCFTALPPVHDQHDLDGWPGDLAALTRPDPVPTARLRLLGIGHGDKLDAGLLLALLRRAVIGRVLVESPTFLSTLMAEALLDELFLNTSTVFVGGKALTIGENAPAFSPERHPQARVLSMHAHCDSFLYTRYQFVYDYARRDCEPRDCEPRDCEPRDCEPRDCE
jgi:riboflavin biosynthesis pyrimidine reductase